MDAFGWAQLLGVVAVDVEVEAAFVQLYLIVALEIYLVKIVLNRTVLIVLKYRLNFLAVSFLILGILVVDFLKML